MNYFVHIQSIFIINWIFLPLISFLRFFRGWNDPQVLQQWNYGQMNIKIATQCIKSGHQSQQNIEIHMMKINVQRTIFWGLYVISEPKFRNFMANLFFMDFSYNLLKAILLEWNLIFSISKNLKSSFLEKILVIQPKSFFLFFVCQID